MVFGNPRSEKLKVLIIGDSYTHGLGVKRKGMYYTTLKRELNAEIFAYAAIGYGTLQEWMILDRYWEDIQPDLILLQVCNNDFIDNHWKLERMSFQTNFSAGVRPFLMNGRIEYRFPGSLGRLRAVFFTHSRFLLILQGKIIRLKSLLAGKGLLPNLWKIIDERGLDFEPFKESVELTETLMKKINDRAEGIPVVAFAVDPIEPYLSQFKEIFRNVGIDFIDEIPYAVIRKESLGKKLRLSDHAHWNEEGHHLVGLTLSQALHHLDALPSSK